VVVGLLVAAQSRINATLASRIIDGGSDPAAAGLVAALVSFGTGLLLLLLGLALVPALRRGTLRIAAAVRSRHLARWQLLGGAGGAWLVATQGLTVPTLGVSLFIVAVVGGATAASLAVDAVGLGPAGRLPVTKRRAAAAALALVAVVITAAPRIESDPGGRAWIPALLVISAGAGIAVQQALNGQVAVAAQHAPAAAVVNFVVGTTVLSVVVLVGALLAGWPLPDLPAAPLLYVGGPIGVAFIAISAWSVPVVGVLRFGLASVTGQLAGGAALDVLAPQPGVVVGPWLVVGLAVTVLAVVVSNRR
jgi:transporter family-2 protein